MPKAATPKRRDTEVTPHTRDCRQVPTSTRFTSVRALHSIYSQKPGAVGAGKGEPAGAPAGTSGATSVRGQVSAQVPLPRVWNCNKPKIVKNYSVYAKQPPPSIVRKTAKTVREWVHPPYPVKRPKANKDRSEWPRNYETFYVSLDGDGSSSASSNANAQPMEQGFFVELDNKEIPEPRRPMCKGKTDVLREIEAKSGQSYINRWNQQEESQEMAKDKQEQPGFREFPCLLPAGERYALKLQTEVDQMASLIAKVKEIRQQQLSAGDVEMEEELKPPQLLRSRTQTLFSISDCHPTLYEYARRLPFVPNPRNPMAVHPRSLAEL